jgi:hypothetical protein
MPPDNNIDPALPDVLPDMLQNSLLVVLCGTAVGTASAMAGAYYAHKQNKFWKILYETGLTPGLLQPQQYRELLQHRIGLTDFVKNAFRDGSRNTIVETDGGFSHPPERFDDDASAKISCLHRQDGRATIPWRQARLRRADRTHSRDQDLDPAFDVGRRQWQLATGNLAPVCGDGESGCRISGAEAGLAYVA